MWQYPQKHLDKTQYAVSVSQYKPQCVGKESVSLCRDTS